MAKVIDWSAFLTVEFAITGLHVHLLRIRAETLRFDKGPVKGGVLVGLESHLVRPFFLGWLPHRNVYVDCLANFTVFV